MIPVSWLARYLYCPMGLYLEAVEGIRPIEDAAMVKGSVFHRDLGRIHSMDESLLERTSFGMVRDQMLKLFRDEYLSIARNTIIASASRLLKFKLGLTETLNEHLVYLNEMAVRRATLVHTYAETFKAHGKRLAKGSLVIT